MMLFNSIFSYQVIRSGKHCEGHLGLVSVIPLDMELSTFETLCLSIATLHGPITLLSIYRPGSEVPTRHFFDQSSSVLECLIRRNSQLLIMGNFNLPLKDETNPDSISFRDILTQFGLRQHVNETTHRLGCILDLVITADNEQVRDLQVQPPTISDHAYIQFWLYHLHSQPLHAIRKTRGWKSLDRRMLSDALVAPSCLLRHRHLMPKRSTSSSTSTLLP